jgi:hypothetical protein
MMTLADARLVEKTDGAPWDIDAYIKVGGYEAWKKCVTDMTRRCRISHRREVGQGSESPGQGAVFCVQRR